MKLLIDDCRDMGDIIARTGEIGLELIKAFPPFEVIYLDHDLGDGISGYRVAVYLEENPEKLPNTMILVTGNPVGRDNMAAIFSKLYPYSKGKTNFSKEKL